MRRMRRVEYNPHHERWLISYADYVTLLLALFVVLYAMSTVDQERLNGVVSGMRTAFIETGTASGGIEAGIPMPTSFNPSPGGRERRVSSEMPWSGVRGISIPCRLTPEFSGV